MMAEPTSVMAEPTSGMKRKADVLTASNETIVGLQRLVTEYADGRMVSPAKKEVVVKFILDATKRERATFAVHQNILEIWPLTEDVLVAHAAHVDNRKYYALDGMKDPLEFKSEDARRSIRLLISKLNSLFPTPSPPTNFSIKFVAEMKVNETVFDLIEGIPECQSIVKQAESDVKQTDIMNIGDIIATSLRQLTQEITKQDVSKIFTVSSQVERHAKDPRLRPFAFGP